MRANGHKAPLFSRPLPTRCLYLYSTPKGSGTTSYFPLSAITDRLDARNQLDHSSARFLLVPVDGAWTYGMAQARGPPVISSGSLACPGHDGGRGGIRPTARDVGLAGERAA